MDSSPLCTQCGQPLQVLEDPSPEALAACSGFEDFLRMLTMMTGSTKHHIQLGYCAQCPSTVLFEPRSATRTLTTNEEEDDDSDEISG